MVKENKIEDDSDLNSTETLNEKENQKKLIENDVLKRLVNQSDLKTSFLVYFFLIFLMPILNIIAIFQSFGGFPKLEYWVSAIVSLFISVLLFFSVEDVLPPLDYMEDEVFFNSELFQYCGGITPFGLFALIANLSLIFYISPLCLSSFRSFFKYLRDSTQKDEFSSDLMILYGIEIMRFILIFYALYIVRIIRTQIYKRNAYLIEKNFEK
jgi:hypothetical protein